MMFPDEIRHPKRPMARIAVLGLVSVLLGLSGACTSPKGSFLASFTPPSPGQVAREAFNPSDPDKRRNSVALLSAAPFGGEQPYLKMYRLLVDDPDATVRAACIGALGRHGQVQDMKLIIPRLRDEAAFVRWEAAKAMQKIHSPDALDPLVGTLSRDEDSDVRQAAALALGQYPQPTVFSALVAALDDTEFSVVQAVLESLTTLTGHDFGYDGGRWLRWARQNQGALFLNHQAYAWQPFKKPPTLLERAQFWKKPPPVPPRLPTGMQSPEPVMGY